MFLEIRNLTSKNLVGMHLSMSLAENRTGELWQKFMPRRKEIKNARASELLSMQVFPSDFNFSQFDFTRKFEKWAAVEVDPSASIPENMESFTLPEGSYAVFFYKGLPAAGEKIFRYIFEEWIPNSNYVIDDRPHFELLGEKYKNHDPESEEEIWIPVRLK